MNESSSIARELTNDTRPLPLDTSIPWADKVDTARECWRFFAAFVRRPLSVGAVAPSSRRLAAAMMPLVDLKMANTVVELGAGTGAITRTLRKCIGRRSRLIALELHRPSANRLRRKFRDVVVVGGSAEHLRHHLDRLGHRHADCVISGLPWGNMSGDLQNRILDAVQVSLRPGGTFSAMAYVHARGFSSARNFRRELERRFRHVTLSPIVWANLPPAFVYYCR